MESVVGLQVFNQDMDVVNEHAVGIETEQPVNKRYKCTYIGCSAAFGKPSRLVQHERVHSGDVCTCNVL